MQSRSGDVWSNATESPRTQREVRGVVSSRGESVVGAEVRLLERPEWPVGGRWLSEPVRTGPDGGFAMVWTPQLVEDAARLFLLVRVDGAPTRVVPATLSRPNRVEWDSDRASFSGRVLAAEGGPLANAQVHVQALSEETTRTVVTDDLGRFSFAGFAANDPLEILVLHPGRAATVESRLKSGDSGALRCFTGLPLRFLFVDPKGSPVSGVQVSHPLPGGLQDHAPRTVSGDDGRAQLDDASDGELVGVRVEARGHVPMVVWAKPHTSNEVTVWPAHEVRVHAYDPRLKIGVPLVALDRQEVVLENGGSWWGDGASWIEPEFVLRPAAKGSAYDLTLPRWPVTITLRAAGRGEREVHVGAQQEAVVVSFVSSAHKAFGWLVIEARRVNGPLPSSLAVVVVNEPANFVQRVRMGRGPTRVRVPTGGVLQVASAAAAEGVWAPKHTLKGPEPGEQVSLILGLRPAIEVRMRVLARTGGEPVAFGEVYAVDLEHEAIDDGQSVTLQDGRAVFWARPGRATRATISAAGHFERVLELAPLLESRDVEVRLQDAASIRVPVRDVDGFPVPFAYMRFWTPQRDGLPSLWKEPEVIEAGADGVATLTGLTGGEGVMEIGARGFHSRRYAVVAVPERGTREFPSIVLTRATRIHGRVVDLLGRPVDAWVTVLGPRVPRIETREGDREFYEPERQWGQRVTTDANGYFVVRHESAGEPVLQVTAQDRPDLAPVVVPVPERGTPVVLQPAARIDLHDTKEIIGIFSVLSSGRLVLLQREPSMRLRPLSTPISANDEHKIHIRRRDGKSVTLSVRLAPEHVGRLEDLNWK